MLSLLDGSYWWVFTWFLWIKGLSGPSFIHQPKTHFSGARRGESDSHFPPRGRYMHTRVSGEFDELIAQFNTSLWGFQVDDEPILGWHVNENGNIGFFSATGVIFSKQKIPSDSTLCILYPLFAPCFRECNHIRYSVCWADVKLLNFVLQKVDKRCGEQSRREIW